MTTQHRLIVSYGLLFPVLVLWFLAANFIRWDETVLEQTIIGGFLGMGFILQIPLYFLSAVSNVATNGALLEIGETTDGFIAIVAAFLYTSPILIAIVRNVKETKKTK